MKSNIQAKYERKFKEIQHFELKITEVEKRQRYFLFVLSLSRSLSPNIDQHKKPHCKKTKEFSTSKKHL